jgi:hypothetical protein
MNYKPALRIILPKKILLLKSPGIPARVIIPSDLSGVHAAGFNFGRIFNL